MGRFGRAGVALLLALSLGVVARGAAAAEGQMTLAVHITLTPRWLDPGETESAITPFMVLYAIHDALVKPMPAGPLSPSLAESWSRSSDGLAYEFVLRPAKFHNGDPVTAEDVKFSFERAAFLTAWREKKLRGVLLAAQGAGGNAATRIEGVATRGGLHQIQRLLAERVVFAPIWENAPINGVGPRVEEAVLTLVPAHPYKAPFEELRLKSR